MRTFSVAEGMPRSIFENKYSRRKADGSFQSWGERVAEVVEGNFSLDETASTVDYSRTLGLARAGVMPFSGRHLQHGDRNQSKKIGEIYCNCTTAMFSFTKFWLLLKGSGVGRCYDGDLCRVNWDNMPNVRFVLEGPDPKTNTGGHPDYEPWIETLQAAQHKYDSESEDVRWFAVGDSAEGWAKVVEILETAAWQAKHANKLFIFDFTPVRRRDSPILGQQGRPASGPVPLIEALMKVASIKGAGMRPWKQAMFIDHYLSDCVALGGIRRSARIAVKTWRDRDIIDFIDLKRGGWLYTANNSVSTDEEFWERARSPAPSHARRVFEAMCSAGYFDETGEPGALVVSRMAWNNEGVDNITPETMVKENSLKPLNLHLRTHEMMGSVLEYAKRKMFPFLVNPCGEIVLAVWGGYCVIGDICLALVQHLDEARDAARLMAQFLIRTNTMTFFYDAEVKRTNRIGVGLTGIHEFAWKHFGYTFWDLIDESKSQPFWGFLAELRTLAEDEASQYSKARGLSVPHTVTTIKPSGTVSKVCSCTEGAHLPAYAHYMRWVQFSADSPEVQDHRLRGYPVKDISSQYSGRVVVGFPTSMPIADLMGSEVVCAGEPSPDQHFEWLRLLEKYWIGPKGNNVSYTLKYDPREVSYEDYMGSILRNQPTVRACSVMPQEDASAYVYLPEERISKEVYDSYMVAIRRFDREAYDPDHLACESGICPTEPDRFGDYGGEMASQG